MNAALWLRVCRWRMQSACVTTCGGTAHSSSLSKAKKKSISINAGATESVSGVFVEYNPNPINHKRVGDCVIRAISKAMDQAWGETYIGICLKGFEIGDLPSANATWGAYLRDHGFTRHAIPADCVDSYTVADFAADHPEGTYILAIEGHVVCVKGGNWYDSWQSGNELPHYYWQKK